ncbi:MAG: fimbrillin family protein [Tannerellaceae bacterium]|nr:fimbrillin family protein [Tannerellaceae bacterium]
MKNMRKFWCIATISCMTFLFGSCEETIPSETSQSETTELRLGVDRIRTRALDDAFEKQDRIGLYVVKREGGEVTTLRSSGNYADNVGFTLQDEADNWQADETIYFPAEGENLDLYAYYPYADPILAAGTTIVNFRIRPDQRDYADYTASDFVTADRRGISRTVEKVQLTFDHKLSQLVFALKAGEGFTPEELSAATITIKNALITATYDLSEGNQGTPVAGAERSDVLPTGTWQVSENDGAVLYGYKGIIIPQELSNETYLEIAVGSRTFTQKFTTPITLKSGESRLFTITMKNTGLEISTTLNPWNYGDPVEGEAEEPEVFDPEALVLAYEIPAAGETITLRLAEEYEYDFMIHWGDGNKTERISTPELAGAYRITHTYPTGNKYFVSITGKCEYIQLEGNSYLTEVIQWGNTGIKSWEQSFSGCQALKQIPPYMPDAISFRETFANSGLLTLPSYLFKACVSAESFERTFFQCTNLTTPGTGIFENCTNAQNFTNTFTACRSLTDLPSNMFSDCINATSFNGCFWECTSLRRIPANLFANCKQATNFTRCFYSCTALETILPGIFDNCIQAETFDYTFSDCKSLTSIPTGLFSSCTNATSFYQTFGYCQALENLPEALFRNCEQATDFTCCFSQCKSLTTLPDDLFMSTINAAVFFDTFSWCSNLKELPEGLFNTCTKARNFHFTFHDCNSLTTIPRSLFDYNPEVVDFSGTFSNCTSLTGGTPNTNGIELWMRFSANYSEYPSEIEVTDCFRNCTKLDNFPDIPAYAGGGNLNF